MKLSKRIFWDTNFSNLQTERDANFIIVRVFERGLMNDFIEVLLIYDKLKIIQALLNASYLAERTFHFAIAYYNLNIIDFKCYGKKQYYQIV